LCRRYEKRHSTNSIGESGCHLGRKTNPSANTSKPADAFQLASVWENSKYQDRPPQSLPLAERRGCASAPATGGSMNSTIRWNCASDGDSINRPEENIPRCGYTTVARFILLGLAHGGSCE